MRVRAGLDEDPARLARAGAGDDAAILAALDAAYATLVRVARLYLGRSDEAYEAVEAVRARVRREGAAGAPHGSLLGLLLDELRRRALAAGGVPHTARALRVPEPPGDPGRFAPDGSWRTPAGLAELGAIAAEELEELARRVIPSLPLDQRELMLLRDVEGWTAEEVELLLGRRPEEQRVLLQRARTCVLGALQAYAAASAAPG